MNSPDLELNHHRPCGVEHSPYMTCEVCKTGAAAPLDPSRCSQCGREPPTHARHCPTLGTFGPAAAELAAQLRALDFGSTAKAPTLSDCYDAHGNPRLCIKCGNQLPLHNPGCALAPGRVYSRGLELAAARTNAALSELASMGSDVCALLHAVQGGATLVITGPDSLGRPGAPHFAGSLESSDGAREANAVGNDLARLLGELAQCWRSPASMRQRVSPASAR